MDYEHGYQVAVFDWTALNPNRKAYPGLELLFAVPNGGTRNKVVAAKLKAEGVEAGIPDMILPVARSGYHGLFIELKIPKTALHEKSYLKPHQRAKMKELSAQGYLCVTCWGDEAVIEVLKWYLQIDALFRTHRQTIDLFNSFDKIEVII